MHTTAVMANARIGFAERISAAATKIAPIGITGRKSRGDTTGQKPASVTTNAPATNARK